MSEARTRIQNPPYVREGSPRSTDSRGGGAQACSEDGVSVGITLSAGANIDRPQ
jgi:hypothetical protein